MSVSVPKPQEMKLGSSRLVLGVVLGAGFWSLELAASPLPGGRAMGGPKGRGRQSVNARVSKHRSHVANLHRCKDGTKKTMDIKGPGKTCMQFLRVGLVASDTTCPL